MLLHLRGLSREELLAALHERDSATTSERALEPAVELAVELELETAYDAAVRAQRLLTEFGPSGATDRQR